MLMEIFWNSFKKNWSSGQGDNIHYFKWRTVVTYVMNFSFFFLISSVSKNISTFPKKLQTEFQTPNCDFKKKKPQIAVSTLNPLMYSHLLLGSTLVLSIVVCWSAQTDTLDSST
jgi:hypothetical protein